MNEKIVFNLIYTMIDANDPLNTVTNVKTFSTEESAINVLKCEYEDMIKDIDNGLTVLDCVRKENNGNNAKIELGFESTDESDAGIPEVEAKHEWRVAKTTIDLHA